MPPAPELEAKIIAAKADARRRRGPHRRRRQRAQRRGVPGDHQPAGAGPGRTRSSTPSPRWLRSSARAGRSCCSSTSPTRRRRAPRPTTTTCCSRPGRSPPAACATSTARPPTASSTSSARSAGRADPTAGWYRAPQPKSYYTNGKNGFGTYPQNAQKLVEDILALADPHVNFAPFDNDGNGSIEALVLICAGTGGEQSGNVNDIWSHKWGITPADARRQDDLHLLHGAGGRQGRRDGPRARAPAARLARPLRHRLLVSRDRPGGT